MVGSYPREEGQASSEIVKYTELQEGYPIKAW